MLRLEERMVLTAAATGKAEEQEQPLEHPEGWHRQARTFHDVCSLFSKALAVYICTLKHVSTASDEAQ